MLIIKADDYLGEEHYEVARSGLTASSFTVEVEIHGITNIYLLNVAYVAVDYDFPHHVNTFDNVPVNFTFGNLVNISTSSTS